MLLNVIKRVSFNDILKKAINHRGLYYFKWGKDLIFTISIINKDFKEFKNF
jgi:hypothetical protein